MLPILRKAEEMRHLCDEAVDEAPPSLLVRCMVPLIYGPRRRWRDARRGEARRIEGAEGFSELLRRGELK